MSVYVLYISLRALLPLSLYLWSVRLIDYSTVRLRFSAIHRGVLYYPPYSATLYCARAQATSTTYKYCVPKAVLRCVAVLCRCARS